MKITTKQKNYIKKLAKKYDLKMILLFGSQVNGRTHQESDIDIAVLPEKNLTFNQEVLLNTDLINVLGNVDLTNLRKASPLLMKQIIDNYRILYQKNNLLINDFEVYALHRYVEAEPLFEMTRRAVDRYANSIKI